MEKKNKMGVQAFKKLQWGSCWIPTLLTRFVMIHPVPSEHFLDVT